MDDPIADIADQSFAGYVCNTNTICCSVLQLTNKKAAITIIAEMSFYCKFQNFYWLTRNELQFMKMMVLICILDCLLLKM